MKFSQGLPLRRTAAGSERSCRRGHEGSNLTLRHGELTRKPVELRVLIAPGPQKRGPCPFAVPGIDRDVDVGVSGRLEQLGAKKTDLPTKKQGPVSIQPVDAAKLVGLFRGHAKLPNTNEHVSGTLYRR